MSAPSMQQVKELRDRTSAGLNDCRSAITEAGGDMAKAEEILRIKLGNKASKAAGRVAAEGPVSLARGRFLSPGRGSAERGGDLGERATHPLAPTRRTRRDAPGRNDLLEARPAGAAVVYSASATDAVDGGADDHAGVRHPVVGVGAEGPAVQRGGPDLQAVGQLGGDRGAVAAAWVGAWMGAAGSTPTLGAASVNPAGLMGEMSGGGDGNGQLVATGLRPKFIDKIAEHGVEVPAAAFKSNKRANAAASALNRAAIKAANGSVVAVSYYGVGDGWCFSCGGFAGHVKLTFGRGTSLTPEPPVAPIGMGKDSRGVDLESVDGIDEGQLASWMRQAAALPGFGKR